MAFKSSRQRKAVMSKLKIKLGNKRKDISFIITDAKGNILKEGGSKEGLRRLKSKN